MANLISVAALRIGFILIAAALLETGGDAVIRHGMRGRLPWAIAAGAGLLVAYGVMVNLVKWDFSKLLGVYVAVFAVTSILVGRFVLGEQVANSTWGGLLLIVAGGAVIQWGAR